MHRQLAIGDGALGFWAALEEVFSATRLLDAQNRQCAQCDAEECSAESQIGAARIWQAATSRMRAGLRSVSSREAKYPKATNTENLMTFYVFRRCTGIFRQIQSSHVCHHPSPYNLCNARRSSSLDNVLRKTGENYAASNTWQRSLKAHVNGEEIQPNQVAA